MLHAKTAVMDRRLVTVGSHNLDALSWAYNLECNVVVEDANIGRQASEHFEQDLSNAVRLRPTPFGLLDRATRRLARFADRLYER
jgi:cardiolipin synthase